MQESNEFGAILSIGPMELTLDRAKGRSDRGQTPATLCAITYQIGTFIALAACSFEILMVLPKTF